MSSNTFSQDSTSTQAKVLPKVRLSFSGGWSYRTINIFNQLPTNLKNDIEGLKTDFDITAGFNFFFHQKYGIGVTFNKFFASNRKPKITITIGSSGNTYTDKESTYTITFFGPIFLKRHRFANGKAQFIAELGAGYLGYKDDNQFRNVTLNLNSSTLGFLVSLGFDLKVTRNFTLGTTFKFIGGSTDETEVYSDGEKFKLPAKESFNRISINGGVGFEF